MLAVIGALTAFLGLGFAFLRFLMPLLAAYGLKKTFDNILERVGGFYAVLANQNPFFRSLLLLFAVCFVFVLFYGILANFVPFDKNMVVHKAAVATLPIMVLCLFGYCSYIVYLRSVDPFPAEVYNCKTLEDVNVLDQKWSKQRNKRLSAAIRDGSVRSKTCLIYMINNRNISKIAKRTVIQNVSADCLITPVDFSGTIPLLHAVRMNDPEACELLAERGAQDCWESLSYLYRYCPRTFRQGVISKGMDAITGAGSYKGDYNAYQIAEYEERELCANAMRKYYVRTFGSSSQECSWGNSGRAFGHYPVKRKGAKGFKGFVYGLIDKVLGWFS